MLLTYWNLKTFQAVQLKKDLLELTETSSELATFGAVEVMPHPSPATDDPTLPNPTDDPEKQSDDHLQSEPDSEPSRDHVEEKEEEVCRVEGRESDNSQTNGLSSDSVSVMKLQDIPTLLFGE